MPFTLKLSRWLAIARHVPLLVAGIALLAGCTTSDLATGTDAESSTIHPDYSQTKGGVTQDGPKGRGRGRRDQKATLVKLVVKPDPASVATGGSTRFAATGILSDGSETAAKVKWSASGGTIDSTGLYTAGRTPGSHRVLAQAISADLADTASVTIGGESATVTAIILSPASLTLQTGATQSLTASAQLSDGSAGPADVTYSATGGTISSTGVYTAGSTAGTYRVIATERSAALADTATVTIAESAPPPSSGTTVFFDDGESGSVMPPWSYVTSTGGRLSPVNSTARAKHGARSIKYEVPGGTADPYSQTLKGEFGTGYYSFYVYVDEGYTVNNAWNMLLGWMTSKQGAPSPIGHIGLEVRGGVLQVTYVQKNCSIGLYPCPTIPGYTQSSGWYLQTASSPNGVTPFPRQRWVHLSVYYKMAATNGQVTVWQDGVKVMDLTAPTLNTWGGLVDLTNSTGKLFLQFGIYGLQVSETRRLYVDDFRVSDYRPAP